MVVMFRNLHPWHLNIPCTLPLLVEMQCHGSFMPCPRCPLQSFNGGSSLLYSWFARTAWKLASRHQGAVTEEGIVEVARERSEAENDAAPSLVAFFSIILQENMVTLACSIPAWTTVSHLGRMRKLKWICHLTDATDAMLLRQGPSAWNRRNRAES